MSNTGNGDGQPPEGESPEAAASPQGGPDPRRVIAQRGYEMGQPLRTIGAQAGVSETAVRKWAKEGKWTRGVQPPKEHKTPVVERVKAEAVERQSNVVALHGGEGGRTVRKSSQNSPCEPPEEVQFCEPAEVCEPDANQGHDTPLDVMFRDRVRQLLENPSPDEAADVAARAVVQVVMTHRVKANRLASIVDRLASQLEMAAESRDLLEALIVEETEPGKRRQAMLKLVSLPSHAGTIRDLTTAFQKLTVLERQAFGLGLTDDPTPVKPPEQAVQQVQSSEFDRIRERVQQRLAGSQAAGSQELGSQIAGGSQ